MVFSTPRPCKTWEIDIFSHFVFPFCCIKSTMSTKQNIHIAPVFQLYRASKILYMLSFTTFSVVCIIGECPSKSQHATVLKIMKVSSHVWFLPKNVIFSWINRCRNSWEIHNLVVQLSWVTSLYITLIHNRH